jgi:hypothetical protein
VSLPLRLRAVSPPALQLGKLVPGAQDEHAPRHPRRAELLTDSCDLHQEIEPYLRPATTEQECHSKLPVQHLARPRLHDWELDGLALLVWLQLTDPDLVDAFQLAGREQGSAELLMRTALAPLPKLDASRAAIVYIVLTITIERITTRVAPKFPRGGPATATTRSSRPAVCGVPSRLSAARSPALRVVATPAACSDSSSCSLVPHTAAASTAHT